MNPRIAIILSVICIAIGVGVGLYSNDKISHQMVTLSTPSGFEGEVYANDNDGGGFSPDSKDTPVYTFKDRGQVKLKNGSYYGVIKDTKKNLDKHSILFEVTRNQPEVKLVATYDTKTLTSLLPKESAAITQAITKKFPGVGPTYTAQSITLYGLGDYAGAVLKSKDPLVDDLRTILRKDGFTWVIAADPLISIGKPAHRSIPPEIIDSVNDLK